MTDRIFLDLDTDIASAGNDLLALSDDLEAAFKRVGETISGELTQAARTGELEFKTLAQTLATEFAQLAIDELFRSRADTQPAPGGDLAGLAPIIVNVAAPAGGSGVGFGLNNQIAQAVAQAVMRGRRFL